MCQKLINGFIIIKDIDFSNYLFGLVFLYKFDNLNILDARQKKYYTNDLYDDRKSIDKPPITVSFKLLKGRICFWY